MQGGVRYRLFEMLSIEHCDETNICKCDNQLINNKQELVVIGQADES